ncbi:MAG: BtpA/SgcQ family protein [Pseudomonadota bacterium]|nr:BtpA/SgcQ family protein [Pseudomonadota bacterium]
MRSLLSRPFAFVGVIHLLPLPGGPRASEGFAWVRERALADAAVLAGGGAHAAILENFGDAPFPAGPVEPHVVAFVAILAAELRARHPELLLGINLLRNDARSALGVAAAAGGAFVRVNVHVGAMVTDQGLLQGDAHHTLRYRRELGGASIGIAADVLVKHAVPLGATEAGSVAADTYRRGGADVLIVTGAGTGRPADPTRAEEVRRAVPEAPLWIGSGVDLASLPSWRTLAQGAIVGTALHRDSRVTEPLELDRVRAFAARV